MVVGEDKGEVLGMKIQVIPCQCGKKMIRRTSLARPKPKVLASGHVIVKIAQRLDPVSPEMWWCGGCGETESISEDSEGYSELIWLYIWKAAQD